MDFGETCGKPAWRAPVALALVLGLTRAAAAQILDEVVVTGSAIGAADTATQGAVGAPQLEEFPTYRAGELLETVPGLIVTQHSAEGKANQYFMRGFNLDHGTDIDITLGDMPVNLRTNAHAQGYSDLNFMIPELVSGLRYSKGPYFADQGDFATAGAVSIEYVDTLPHDLASMSAGTLGDYRGFTAMARPWAAGNLLLAAEYDHVDGPWAIPDNFNKGNLLLRYSRGTRENGFSVTGMFMDDAWHATNQIPERAVSAGLIGVSGTIDPSDGGSSERYSLSAKYVDTDAAGQFKANAYFIGSALQLFNDFDFYVTFPPPVGDQFEQQERRHIYGGDVSYTVLDQLMGRESDTTVGVQTRTDVVNLGLFETTGRVVHLTVRDDNVVEASGGVYAENRTRWLDKFRTVAGLREDVFWGDDQSTLAANSGVARMGMFSPKLNAILGPWDNTEFYFSGGEGFHSNDLRGAVSTVNALQTELTGSTVNQPRTPLLTKAYGYEAGIRSAIAPQVEVSAALFELDLGSEATFDGDAAGTSVGRPSTRRGIELTGSYTPLPWLVLSGDFAFTRARFADTDTGAADVEPGHPGSYIPEAAKIIASAEIAVQNLGAWDGGLRFRYFGPRPLLEDASVRSGPTALFDARIGYRINDRLKTQFDVFNLFNSHAHQIDYWYPSQLANETSPVYDIHFKPVEPLSFRLTAALTF
ncbi:MAG TPA: TonB-dependent receptor [Stellaceae bacterium]|nr:TonB-dependent receptor [Stellaceae bacterium]